MKNEKVNQAFELYKQGLKQTEIAEKLIISVNTIKTWKRRYDWDNTPVKRKRGGQPGNKNALGNKGGKGAPFGNKNAVGHASSTPIGNTNAIKHGLYCGYVRLNLKP